MRAFAELLENLSRAPRQDIACRWLADYIRRTPDPDRGQAIGLLTGAIVLPGLSPRRLRDLVLERVDPVLYDLSYREAGSVAETAALLWPGRRRGEAAPDLPSVLRRIGGDRPAGPTLSRLLDDLDTAERRAVLSLLTRRRRPLVSGHVVRAALARAGVRQEFEVAEMWQAAMAPDRAFFSWLEGRGPRPRAQPGAAWRPVMVPQSVGPADVRALDPGEWSAEWKWDGIRVQLAARGSERRIWSGDGDALTDRYPRLAAALSFDAVLDGVLIGNDRRDAAEVRLFDILAEGDSDLRTLPLAKRRVRLERLLSAERPRGMAVSRPLGSCGAAELADLHRRSRQPGRSGMVLKRLKGSYRAGATGEWLVWRAEPLTVEAVLLHVVRAGTGAATCSFGVWRDGELVPVARTDHAPSDAVWQTLAHWVRQNTVRRSGPVREVAHELVCRIAFDGVRPASRRKAGLVLHNPRVQEVVDGRPAAGADRLDRFDRWLEAGDGEPW